MSAQFGKEYTNQHLALSPTSTSLAEEQKSFDTFISFILSSPNVCNSPTWINEIGDYKRKVIIFEIDLLIYMKFTCFYLCNFLIYLLALELYKVDIVFSILRKY